MTNDDRFRLAYNRVHGVHTELLARAESARAEAETSEVQLALYSAAALRGKAVAYTEAAALVEGLEKDRKLGVRRGLGWRRKEGLRG